MFSDVDNQFIDNEIIEKITNFSLTEKIKLVGDVKGHTTIHLHFHPDDHLLMVKTWDVERECLSFIDISKLRLKLDVDVTTTELKPNYIVNQRFGCCDYVISHPVRSSGSHSNGEMVLTLYNKYKKSAHFDINVFSNQHDFEPISNINRIPCRKGCSNKFDVCYPNHMLHTSSNDIILTDLNSLKEIAEVNLENEELFVCMTTRANNESYLIGSANRCVYLFDNRTHKISTKIRPFVKHNDTVIEKLISLKQNDHLFVEAYYEEGIYLVDLRNPKTYVYVAEKSHSLSDYEQPPSIDPVAGIISRYANSIQYFWSLENGKLLSTPTVTESEYSIEEFTCSMPYHPNKPILFGVAGNGINLFANKNTKMV